MNGKLCAGACEIMYFAGAMFSRTSIRTGDMSRLTAPGACVWMMEQGNDAEVLFPESEQ
jgi:hypothetical protein